MITIPTGTFDQDYLYILGGGSCPLDTAILTVSKPSSLAYNVQVSSNFICEDECVTVTIDHLDTDQGYRYIYQIADDIGNTHIDSIDLDTNDPQGRLEYCIGTGALADFDVMAGRTYNVILTEIKILGIDCNSAINELVQFSVGTNTAATVDRNFCAGQEITIGSDVYNEANPSGETIIPNTMGCDSVVTVELTFASQVSGTANAEFCEGGSIEVL